VAQRPPNPFEPPTHDVLDTPDRRAEVVASLASRSVISGAFGISCCGIILGPLAISYANRAEAAMISFDKGHESFGTIKTGRTLGYLALGLWFAAVVLRIGLFLVGEPR
jgi:sulfite exporter TauE/SafE